MQIFASVLEEASINTIYRVVESCQFAMPLVAISSEPLKIRPKLSKELSTQKFSMGSNSLCVCTFNAVNCRGSLEMTRQATVCAILIDSYARCHVGLLNISHVTYN